MMELESLEETAGWPETNDDPEVIYESDMDHYGPWVECEMGYETCSGPAYAVDMVNVDGGWACWACYRTAREEFEHDRRM